MHDFNSIELTKKGIKEAQSGNLNQALILFNQAAGASFHIKPKSIRIKIGLEILTVQNLCDAIISIIDEDFEVGKDKYIIFRNYFENYFFLCKTNQDNIENTGSNYFIQDIDELTKLYRGELNLIES